MIQKSLSARRAVSPVVAIILLIGLTVAVRGIVYFVVMPMFTGEGELTISDYSFRDTNDNDLADELTVKMGNKGTEEITIEDAEFLRNGIPIYWTMGDEEITIDGGKLGVTVKFNADSESDELGYGDVATLAWDSSGSPFSLEVRIPAKFSPFSLLYEEDFEDAHPAGWIYYELFQHGGGSHSLADWLIVDDPLELDKCWKCTNNDCEFIIQQSAGRDYYDVNVSYDLMTNDDDANGVIFRYDDSGGFAKFYVIWWTDDHPGPSNPPSNYGNEAKFNWATPSDALGDRMLTAHYVEQTASGYTWYKLVETSWIRSNNQWYTWRIIADGSSFSVQIDGETKLTFIDTQISHGYVGLISMANANCHYDNIYIWSG